MRSRSTPTEQTTSTAEPSARRPSAEHGTRSLTLGRGTGGCAGASVTSPDAGRVLLELPAQQPLGRQPVERVLPAVRPPVLVDGANDAGQGIDGRDVAVDDGERLAIVGPDADLEAHGAGVRVVDDAAHLEPAHLAGDDAVLDHGHGTGGADRIGEREVRVGGRRAAAAGGSATRREQGAALDVPHRDREAKAGGAPGEQAGRPVGEDVERRGAVAERPGQRRAEATFGLVLERAATPRRR